MAIKLQNSRYKFKGIGNSGLTISLGPSSDHKDGTWNTNGSQVYPGEAIWNHTTQQLCIGYDNLSGTTGVSCFISSASIAGTYMPLSGGSFTGPISACSGMRASVISGCSVNSYLDFVNNSGPLLTNRNFNTNPEYAYLYIGDSDSVDFLSKSQSNADYININKQNTGNTLSASVNLVNTALTLSFNNSVSLDNTSLNIFEDKIICDSPDGDYRFYENGSGSGFLYFYDQTGVNQRGYYGNLGNDLSMDSGNHAFRFGGAVLSVFKLSSSSYAHQDLCEGGIIIGKTATQYAVAPRSALEVHDPNGTNSTVIFGVRNSGDTNYVANIKGNGDLFANIGYFSGGVKTNAISGLSSVETIKVDESLNSIKIGVGALSAITSATDNIAIGSQALSTTSSGGAQNIGIGSQALRHTTTGDGNIAIGYQAMSANTIGLVNIAIGYQSLYSNISGDDHIAIGPSALKNNTTGDLNIAIGIEALSANTTGEQNTAIGITALKANTTASSNTSIGYLSGLENTTGAQNVFLGAHAGRINATGDGNICLGYSAITNSSISSSIVIGNRAFADASNQLVIGSLSSQITTATTASSGANSLPANPAAFLRVKINGSIYKMPLYLD